MTSDFSGSTEVDFLVDGNNYAFDYTGYLVSAIKGSGHSGRQNWGGKHGAVWGMNREDGLEMTESEKPGFLKSLFGHGQKSPSRAPIPLYIPLSVMKVEKDTPAVANIESVWGQVIENKLGPLLLLQEADRYLEKINPMPLPYEQRERLTGMVLNEVATAIGALFSRFFHEGGGIPETREQRDSISYAVRAAEQVSYSYKLLFRQNWADPSEDRIAQEKIPVVVLRILECVRLEQLLRAFRYQKLPQHAWRDANQLYFALRGHWNTAAKYPLKIRLSLEDATSRVELFPGSSSVEQLYLAIQLTGVLDVISWPVHLMYRVGGYLDDVEIPLVAGGDKGDALPVGHIVVQQNQGTPPRFNRGPEQLGETLLIDINSIVRRAMQDRGALLAATVVKNQTLREIPEQDRVPFLDLLLHRLRSHQRRDTRQLIFATNRARVYGGFEAVYRLFRDISHWDKGNVNVARERRFWDDLARHSSIVATDEDSVLESRWIVADESEGGIQLRQQESDYSMPLYVGRLLAYNSGGQDISDSRLGYVVRIQRINGEEVEVAIARLREVIQPVVVEDLEAMDQRALPALLIRDAAGRMQLLCDNKYKFITGERLSVINDANHYTGALGDILLAQADFTVFELHTA